MSICYPVENPELLSIVKGIYFILHRIAVIISNILYEKIFAFILVATASFHHIPGQDS